MRSRSTERRPGKLSKVRSSRNSSSRNVAGASPGGARGAEPGRAWRRTPPAPLRPCASRSAPTETANGETSRIAWNNRSGVVAMRSTSMYWQALRPSRSRNAQEQRSAAAATAAEHDGNSRAAAGSAFERGEHAPLEGRTLRNHHCADPPAAWHVDAVAARRVDCFRVARIGVTDDPESGIAGEHALQLLVGFARAVGDDDHACVQRVADADAAAMMNRNPGGAGRGVEQRVQHRPVGNRVAAVAHAFGLAVGRRHRPGVEMVAADDDRRLHARRGGRGRSSPGRSARGRRSRARRCAPADPGRRRARAPAESSGRALRPREHLERELVGRVDVGRIARQRRPAERALALAEERPDVLGHEAGDLERVRRRRRAPPGRGCCCRSRRRSRRCAGSASMARTCSAIAAIDRRVYSPGLRPAQRFGFARASCRSGRSRSARRAPTSGRSPRRA